MSLLNAYCVVPRACVRGAETIRTHCVAFKKKWSKWPYHSHVLQMDDTSHSMRSQFFNSHEIVTFEKKKTNKIKE